MYSETQVYALNTENEQLMKLSSQTHVANHRLLNMMKSAKDLLTDHNCNEKTEQLSKKLRDLQREYNSVLRDIKSLTEVLTIVSPQYQAPMEFIIDNFSEKKETNVLWYSAPFYTYNRGYKFRLMVCPNGCGAGRGTHLSVYAQLMRGDFDNELEWPFEGDIRVELLNWRKDKNHHSYTIRFNRYNDPDSTFSSRVTDQEAALNLGIFQFLSHADLTLAITNTEYLLNDYLKLRVSAIVYSTPLLPLTPAWQDSLSTTQSGAQFTISKYSKRKQFNNEYFSPPFTTSPQGYRLYLSVFANGNGDGKGSHLSIFAHIMKGQHDDRLQWPFTGIIIIELLNWLEDKGHYKKAILFNKNHKGMYGSNKGYYQFISQAYLSSYTNPQYLFQDCIHVRVLAIANN